MTKFKTKSVKTMIMVKTGPAQKSDHKELHFSPWTLKTFLGVKNNNRLPKKTIGFIN